MGKDAIVFHNLDKVKFIVKDATGLDILYAYQDLVFSEHGVILFQFDADDVNLLRCWVNTQCYESEKNKMLRSLKITAGLNDMKIDYQGKFEMTQKEDEEQIELNFYVGDC